MNGIRIAHGPAWSSIDFDLLPQHFAETSLHPHNEGDQQNVFSDPRMVQGLDHNPNYDTPSAASDNYHNLPLTSAGSLDASLTFEENALFANTWQPVTQGSANLPSTALCFTQEQPVLSPTPHTRTILPPPMYYANDQYAYTQVTHEPTPEAPDLVYDNYATRDTPFGYVPVDERYHDSHSTDESDSDAADPCYAKLLYSCLMEVPNHTLSLRQLYAWVEQHSIKARDSSNRGWQNSVRHNLSMNAGFERVPPVPGQRARGSLWRLTQHAIQHGVESTTRYRKDPKRKSPRAGAPAPNRVASGAKGGQATRRAANRRQAAVQRSEATSDPQSHVNRRQRHRLEPYPMLREPLAGLGTYPSQRDSTVTPHLPQRDGTASPYFIDAEDIVDTNDPLPSSGYVPESLTQMDFSQMGDFKFEFPDVGYPVQSLFDNPCAPSPSTEVTNDSFLNHDIPGF